MTEEEALALCFEDRDIDYGNLEILPLENLKYKIGDTIKLKSLKNILSYNRVSSCVYNYTGEIELTVDEGGTFSRRLDVWDRSEIITDIYECTVCDIVIHYYVFNNGWADEYMIEDTKLKKLLDKVRRL